MKAPYGKTFTTAEGQVRVRFPAKAATGKAGYIRLSWSEGGKRQQTTAGTMDRWEDAWREANDIGARVAIGKGLTASVRLGFVLDEWIAEGKEHWSIRYLEDNDAISENVIKPVLGNVLLEEMTFRQVSDLIHSQRSESAKRHVRAALSSALGYAKGRKMTERDPEELLARIRRPKSLAYLDPSLYPNTAEVTAMAKAMKQTRNHKKAEDFVPPDYWQLMILTAAYCGLRRGELWELRGTDIHGKTMKVSRQVVRTKSGMQVTAPKNGSSREVFIADKVPGGFRLRKMLRERAKAVGSGLMFPAPRGGYWSPSNFSKRVWNPAREIAWGAASDWTLHGLRHYFCRYWLDKGLEPMDVSRFAGHANVVITLSIYVSPTAGAMERAERLT